MAGDIPEHSGELVRLLTDFRCTALTAPAGCASAPGQPVRPETVCGQRGKHLRDAAEDAGDDETSTHQSSCLVLHSRGPCL